MIKIKGNKVNYFRSDRTGVRQFYSVFTKTFRLGTIEGEIWPIPKAVLRVCCDHHSPTRFSLKKKLSVKKTCTKSYK